MENSSWLAKTDHTNKHVTSLGSLAKTNHQRRGERQRKRPGMTRWRRESSSVGTPPSGVRRRHCRNDLCKCQAVGGVLLPAGDVEGTVGCWFESVQRGFICEEKPSESSRMIRKARALMRERLSLTCCCNVSICGTKAQRNGERNRSRSPALRCVALPRRRSCSFESRDFVDHYRWNILTLLTFCKD